MKDCLLGTTCALLLYTTVILLSPGCRSEPVAPKEARETIKTETQEGAKSPETASPPKASKPHKEVIARLLPESLIAAPAKDLAAPRVEYNTRLSNRQVEPRRRNSWRYRSARQGDIVGFEFSNGGGNRILPPLRDPLKNQFFARDFQFRFDDRARQDIHLMISDWAPSRDRVFRLSDLMNRLMLFFPRTFLPAIVSWHNRNIVTLPTGEEVEFDALTHEIVAGVFSETPVDLNPDRSAREFPGIEYGGRGVAIRADARGADPRMGTTAVITTGTPAKDCDKGILCRRCEVKPQELWEQSGAARFKYATDSDFDRFLMIRCGFGLPRAGPGFALAIAANP
jgi:hypothetical protein